jgi:hypothetical protein
VNPQVRGTLLLESGAVRVRRPIGRIACPLVVIAAAVVMVPHGAIAQVVEVTPAFSIEPSTETTPWVIQMAIGAAILGVLILLGIGFGYMRFAPKFFGREEAAKLAPGARPPQLVRQAAAVRWTAPPSTTHTPADQVPAAAGPERASVKTAAPPAGEPAAQADAVGQGEAAAPEARPSAKTAEETGERPPPEGPPAAEAPATESPAAPPATESPAPPPQPAPAPGPGSLALDQETFDRVLQEQLDKGVDRRVAEGRARAAAVVAARKKAQA